MLIANVNISALGALYRFIIGRGHTFLFIVFLLVPLIYFQIAGGLRFFRRSASAVRLVVRIYLRNFKVTRFYELLAAALNHVALRYTSFVRDCCEQPNYLGL